jgi:hypothetical protein
MCSANVAFAKCTSHVRELRTQLSNVARGCQTAKVTNSAREEGAPVCPNAADCGSNSYVLSYLTGKHGLLIPSDALQAILHFKTASAFERSIRRGHLGIPLRRLPHRRGLFARVEDVAAYLDGLPQVNDDFETDRDESAGRQQER